MMNSRGEQVFVEREPYERNGRRYFSYFVSGTIRGKDVRVAVTPPDKGGYAVLDIVFGEENRVALVAKPYEIKDENDGQSRQRQHLRSAFVGRGRRGVRVHREAREAVGQVAAQYARQESVKR